jgi:hypothetical protein
MAHQYWVNPVPPLHNTSGVAYNTSVTLTDVSTLPNITIPANLLEIGTTIRLRACGQFSNTATPTLLMGFYYGGVAGVALAASSAVTTTTAAAAWPWILEYQGRVRSIGSAGSIVGQGMWSLGTALTAFTYRPIPEVAASRTVTIDTTTAKAITIGAQWGTNSASNTLTCDEISVELLS